MATKKKTTPTVALADTKPGVDKNGKFIHPLPDGHYTGHNVRGYAFGFDVRDGRIKPAPILGDVIREVQAEIDALNMFQDNVNKYCDNRYNAVCKKRNDWWREIGQSFDLESSGEGWVFDYSTGELYKKPTEKGKEKGK